MMKKALTTLLVLFAFSSSPTSAQQFCDINGFDQADSNGDGWVHSEEFAPWAMYNCGLAYGEANVLFAVHDNDWNGFHSRAEFYSAIATLVYV